MVSAGYHAYGIGWVLRGNVDGDAGDDDAGEVANRAAQALRVVMMQWAVPPVLHHNLRKDDG
jgi:hypothetical protein